MWDVMKEAEGASNIAHAMILLQQLPVDKAMYYVANPQGAYCGMYYYPSQKVTPAYYTFKTFNSLYTLKNELAVSTETSPIAVLGAANDNAGAVMITNSKPEAVKVSFDLKNVPGKLSATIIDQQRTFEKIEFTTDFEMPPYSVLLLEANPAQPDSSSATGEKGSHNFAGLAGN